MTDKVQGDRRTCLNGILQDWWGWESVFYIEGGASLVWLLLWLVLASDTPASHPLISHFLTLSSFAPRK